MMKWSRKGDQRENEYCEGHNVHLRADGHSWQKRYLERSLKPNHQILAKFGKVTLYISKVLAMKIWQNFHHDFLHQRYMVIAVIIKVPLCICGDYMHVVLL